MILFVCGNKFDIEEIYCWLLFDKINVYARRKKEF
jgi:hypothetical protein